MGDLVTAVNHLTTVVNDVGEAICICIVISAFMRAVISAFMRAVFNK
jgi:hypothetical protein